MRFMLIIYDQVVEILEFEYLKNDKMQKKEDVIG